MQTNYREDLQALQELKWKASDREDRNLAKIFDKSSDTSKLKITLGEKVDQASVTPYSLSLVRALMLLSDVTSLKISSAYRGPEDQARVMHQNLKSGKRIRYSAAGTAVTKAYDTASKAKLDDATAQKLMCNEIWRLGPENVSKHAAPPNWLNVIDIDPSSIEAMSRQKFIEAVNKFVGTYVDKFLHPGNSKDPAYHIEIPQGRTLVVREQQRST